MPPLALAQWVGAFQTWRCWLQFQDTGGYQPGFDSFGKGFPTRDRLLPLRFHCYSHEDFDRCNRRWCLRRHRRARIRPLLRLQASKRHHLPQEIA
jgi:hypothetical protein